MSETDTDTDIYTLLVKGASGSFVLKILFTGLGLLTSFILARLLGVEQYGNYAYVMSWIFLLGILAGLGLDKLMVRFIAAYNLRGEWGKIKGLLRYSIIAVLIVSILIFAAVYLFLEITIPDTAESEIYIPLLIALILIPLKSLLSRLDASIRGFRWIISAQIPSMLIQPVLFISFLGLVWFINMSRFNVSFAISLNVSAAVAALVVAAYLHRKVLPGAVKKSVAEYEPWSWIRSALPLMVMGGLYMINGQADILMLGYIKGTELSGIYQIADRGAGLILLVLSAVVTSLAPVIAHLYAGNDIERMQRIVTRASRATLILSLPVVLFLAVFGKWFLGLFGPEFKDGYTALVILSFSQVVNVASGPVANILMMTGHERDAAIGVGASTVVNVVLNAVFIPLWGLAGAALATGTSTIMWNLIFIWYVRQRIRIHPTFLGIIRSGWFR